MTDSVTDQRTPRRFCPACGTEAWTEWRFCAACGSALPDLASLTRREAPPPESPSLVEPGVEPDPKAAPEPEVEVASGIELDAELADIWPDWPVPDNSDISLVIDPPPTATETTEVPTDGDAAPAPAEQFAARLVDRTRWSQAVLLAAAGCAVATVISLFALNRRLESGSSPSSVDRAENWAELFWVPLLAVASIAGLVLLVRWTLALRAITTSLGSTPQRFSDARAAGAWVVPGVNLVVGPLELADAHRTINEAAPRTQTPRRLLLWAWAALCAVGGAVAIAAAAASPQSLSASLDANTWSAVGYALVAAGLLVLVVVLSATTHVALEALRDQHGRDRLVEPRPDLLTALAGVGRPGAASEPADVELI